MSVMYILIGFWNFNPQKNSTRLKQEYRSIFNVFIDKNPNKSTKWQKLKFIYTNFKILKPSIFQWDAVFTIWTASTSLLTSQERTSVALQLSGATGKHWKMQLSTAPPTLLKNRYNILVLEWFYFILYFCKSYHIFLEMFKNKTHIPISMTYVVLSSF